MRLVLADVDESVFWMNHAPSRSGDFEAIGNFINYWPERFSDSEPNASLAGDPCEGDYDVLPLTLSDPVYELPPQLYQGRFYNSLQTFKLQDDLRVNILEAYDTPSADFKVESVLGQARAVRGYMDNHPNSLVKGFAIFEWQNANWKRGGFTQ